MKRRNFIKMSLFTASCIFSPISLIASTSIKTLVVVELNGGNDSLNTVIPYTNKVYKESRPTLALNENEYIKINKKFALNGVMKNIFKEYQNNNVAIINGLGYEKPNLSHFRSIDIVETASNSNEYLKSGWLDNILTYSLEETMPCHALVIGKRKKNLLFHPDSIVLEFKNINKFIKQSQDLDFIENSTNNSALKKLFLKNNEIVRANKIFKNKLKEEELLSFEENEISTSFKEAFKIIKAKLNIPVIKISQKGYDTHSAQKQTHTQLLNEFDTAVGLFVNALKKENLYENILIMTYSEFGRRVNENGSFGTDHGTASSHFVIGDKIKGGMYGKHPSLNKLKKNNLIFTTHYRSYYNTILSEWFNKKDNRFKDYKNLKFL